MTYDVTIPLEKSGPEFDRGDLARHMVQQCASSIDLPSIDYDQALALIEVYYATLARAAKEHERVEIHQVGVYRRVQVPERTYWLDHNNDGTITQHIAPAHTDLRFDPSDTYQRLLV